MRHEVPATANKSRFHNSTERSRRRGALRSEIKEEAEGRGTFAEQGTLSA